MMKKFPAAVVSVAVLVVGLGHPAVITAALTTTRGPVARVTVTPMIATGLGRLVTGAASRGIPTLTPGVLAAPLSPAMPNIAVPAPVAVPDHAGAKPDGAAGGASPIATGLATASDEVGRAARQDGVSGSMQALSAVFGEGNPRMTAVTADPPTQGPIGAAHPDLLRKQSKALTRFLASQGFVNPKVRLYADVPSGSPRGPNVLSISVDIPARARQSPRFLIAGLHQTLAGVRQASLKWVSDHTWELMVPGATVYRNGIPSPGAPMTVEASRKVLENLTAPIASYVASEKGHLPFPDAWQFGFITVSDQVLSTLGPDGWVLHSRNSEPTPHPEARNYYLVWSRGKTAPTADADANEVAGAVRTIRGIIDQAMETERVPSDGALDILRRKLDWLSGQDIPAGMRREVKQLAMAIVVIIPEMVKIAPDRKTQLEKVFTAAKRLVNKISPDDETGAVAPGA